MLPTRDVNFSAYKFLTEANVDVQTPVIFNLLKDLKNSLAVENIAPEFFDRNTQIDMLINECWYLDKIENYQQGYLIIFNSVEKKCEKSIYNPNNKGEIKTLAPPDEDGTDFLKNRRVLFIQDNYVISIGTKTPLNAIKHLYEYAKRKNIITQSINSGDWGLSAIARKNLIQKIKEKGVSKIQLGLSAHLFSDNNTTQSKIKGFLNFFNIPSGVSNSVKNSFFTLNFEKNSLEVEKYACTLVNSNEEFEWTIFLKGNETPIKKQSMKFQKSYPIKKNADIFCCDDIKPYIDSFISELYEQQF